MKIIKVNENNYINEIDSILNRSDDSFDEVDKIVADIIKQVRKDGDKALIDYTEKFDGIKLCSIKVTKEEIDEALNNVDKSFIQILERAKANITGFHEKQLENLVRIWSLLN